MSDNRGRFKDMQNARLVVSSSNCGGGTKRRWGMRKKVEREKKKNEELRNFCVPTYR